ncbi:MAG: cytochrome C oxidase subunit IV family protein [Acidimicrobiia bacterium]|nr:cytochrome C oxidase subunit IV family protein [Acidimicrobiia bacterium]
MSTTHDPAFSSSDPAMESPEPGVEEHYPDEWQYIKVALVLFAITMVEVAIYYWTGFEKGVITLMVFMMIAKFSIVALYFMHLRFDSKLFRRLFVTGIVLAVVVYLIALSSLHIWEH